MRGGLKRFGLYVAAVAGLVGLVYFAAREEPRSLEIVLAQAIFIAGMSYLMTFLFWPRRVPHSAAHPSMREERSHVPNEPRPEVDRRPVAVIGNRPAGSKPGERVHVAEAPMPRGTRGRRPDDRQPTGDFRWPAQR